MGNAGSLDFLDEQPRKTPARRIDDEAIILQFNRLRFKVRTQKVDIILKTIQHGSLPRQLGRLRIHFMGDHRQSGLGKVKGKAANTTIGIYKVMV
jgi:hypothetical protein